ncbi:UNVERIFIED_CONTAM: putative pectate lyase 19 [Sesamum radiatum]|uniref:Pectate lyase n=1 Tax=Sesamum radiatum TaxID=300843 RepID=A0AAW2RZR8_SESRA
MKQLMAFTDRRLSVPLILGILSLVLLLPECRAAIAKYDEYLQKRAEEASEEALKAFDPNPEKLADDLNYQVSESGDLFPKFMSLLRERTGNRRLKEGDCKATNPIDRCWRCDPDWAKNRQKLADCARGFGHRATGGQGGRFYVVTDPSDDDMDKPKPGTLRHAAIQKEPLWIIFANHMVIKLKEELLFSSNKTVDGRGAKVHIAYGAGITLQFVHNVIIHNIRIHNIHAASGGMIRDAVDHIGLRTRSDGDGISVFNSNTIWIDHVSLSKGTDGLIDVIEGSTAITISNCKFNNHNDVMLLGANDSTAKDSIMQITVAFNRFGKGLIQRMPRIRWGFVHVINNDYSTGKCTPSAVAPTPPLSARVTKRIFGTKKEWEKWQWRSEGDKFTNGAYFIESGPPIRHEDLPTEKSLIKFKPGSFAGRLTRYAGALKCREGKLC